MKKTRHFILLLALLSAMFLHAYSVDSMHLEQYAGRYAAAKDTISRLRIANDFFAYLYQADYIDQPISFPLSSHIDSVDVNVFYYIAEWYYGEGNYQAAIDYCTRATQCMGVVDDASKSDVYALLGAACFRTGAFDKAIDALHQSYETDKATGDFDRMSSTLNSIASVFAAAGKPQEAEKYVIEAISVNSLTENLQRRAVLYGTAAEIYEKAGDREQSLGYALKALDTERLVGDSARIGIRLSQVATAQLGLSRIGEARRSLSEAIPLLLRSGNMHSWAICQNQLGDILASDGENDAAANCYMEAAKIFLRQGDRYNEMHAREGLYKVLKDASPSDAMMHLERAKLLHDSIYQTETGEALARYNALYFNDLLQMEKEHAEQRSRTVIAAVVIASLAVLAIVAVAVVVAYRRHRRSVGSYEQRISTMQDQHDAINRQYQNVVAETMQAPSLTDDDRQFLCQLTEVIETSAEKGITDVESIAHLMHDNTVTLRRRLAQTLSLTPQAFILQVRMQKARRLLLDYRDMTISEVADRCGYSLHTNFTRAFMRFYGIKPSEVRLQKADTSTTETHDTSTPETHDGNAIDNEH